jgi:hypothetical protein
MLKTKAQVIFDLKERPSVALRRIAQLLLSCKEDSLNTVFNHEQKNHHYESTSTVKS